MEEEMENLIKEREIRLNTGVETSTIATSIARISTKIVSASKTQSIGQNSVEKLSKDMAVLLLKDIEIEKLTTQLEKIKNDKIRADNTYMDEVQKKIRLTRQIEIYENESLIAQTLVEAKEMIEIYIKYTMTEIWTYIQIIF